MDGLNGPSHFGLASTDLDRMDRFSTEVLGTRVQWQTERQVEHEIRGMIHSCVRVP